MLTPLLVKFRRDPLQNTLLASILCIHVLFLLLLLIAPAFPQKKERQPLVVKTLLPKLPTKPMAMQANKPRLPPVAKTQTALPPKAPEIKKQTESLQTESAPAPIKTPAVKKTPLVTEPAQIKTAPTPAVKKEPAIADKKIAPAKQSVKKNPPPQNRANISDALRKELEESIAKIENKNDTSLISRKASTQIALQIDTVSGEDNNTKDETSDYTDLLIHHMHRLLSLPEYGEVKIQLHLRQDGSVVKVIVLKAQNDKNRQYLESNLPHLRFPRFEGAYSSKKEHLFVLTFCNET